MVNLVFMYLFMCYLIEHVFFNSNEVKILWYNSVAISDLWQKFHTQCMFIS